MVKKGTARALVAFLACFLGATAGASPGAAGSAREDFDVVIVGGSLAGASAALAISKKLDEAGLRPLRIAVVDGRPREGTRASHIALHKQSLDIQAWLGLDLATQGAITFLDAVHMHDVAEEVSGTLPIRRPVIEPRRASARVGELFRTRKAGDARRSLPPAAIASINGQERDLRALGERVADFRYGTRVRTGSSAGRPPLRLAPDHVEIDAQADGVARTFRARYLIAADGAQSTVRELAGLELSEPHQGLTREIVVGVYSSPDEVEVGEDGRTPVRGQPGTISIRREVTDEQQLLRTVIMAGKEARTVNAIIPRTASWRGRKDAAAGEARQAFLDGQAARAGLGRARVLDPAVEVNAAPRRTIDPRTRRLRVMVGADRSALAQRIAFIGDAASPGDPRTARWAQLAFHGAMRVADWVVAREQADRAAPARREAAARAANRAFSAGTNRAITTAFDFATRPTRAVPSARVRTPTRRAVAQPRARGR